MKLYALLFLISLPYCVIAMKRINREVSAQITELLAKEKEDKGRVIIKYVFGQMSKEEFEKSDSLSNGQKQLVNDVMDTPDVIESVPFGG